MRCCDGNSFPDSLPLIIVRRPPLIGLNNNKFFHITSHILLHRAGAFHLTVPEIFMTPVRMIKAYCFCLVCMFVCLLSTLTFTANWTQARMIKYTNFPAKYMNYNSKLHWNIVVFCQVSAMWNNRWGIGISELHNHEERNSAFSTCSKWILLVFYFYDIFWYFSH